MVISVENEAYIFIAVFLVGIILGFLFDVFKMLRMLKFGNVWIFMTDLIFWTGATVIFLASVLYFNDGQMRWYEFAGIFLGLLLYFLLLSRYITAIFLWIAGVIYKIFRIILKILLTPARFLYKILSMPVLFIFGIFRKVYTGCKNRKSNSENVQNAETL